MTIVLILIPITLLLVTMGILLFNWAVKSGQYDDLEGPAHRILYDDDQDMIPDDARQPQDDAAPRSNTRNPRTGHDADASSNQDNTGA